MADNQGLNTEIDTVLIKVTSRCNINCTYCYVYNMGDDNWSRLPKLISSETIEATCAALISLIANQKKYFSVILHGGEPFLLGSIRLNDLLSRLRNILSNEYPISIQTNGILITSKLLDVCSQYDVSVAVSIDGPKHIHDRLRVTHSGKGTFEDVMKGIDTLKAHPRASFLNAGMLAVVDPNSDPFEIYSFFKKISAPSVDFLYKDGNHDKLPTGKASLESLEYGKWMERLLSIYLQDTNPISIRVIDDMLKAIMGGMVTKEGMGITDFGIIIIDTDGTIMKNDTLKSAFNGADRFERYINVRDENLIAFIHSLAFQQYKQMQRPTNLQCRECTYLNICGGGMILHRWKQDSEFNNPSVYCADQQYLIAAMHKAISKHLHHA